MPKKKSKGRNQDSLFEELESEGPAFVASTEEAEELSPMGKKKPKKGKKADISVDEAPEATIGDEDDSNMTSGLSKGAHNAFAGLDVDDAENGTGDDGSDNGNPAVSAAPTPKGKKKKKKKKNVDNAFALLDADSDGEAQDDPQPTVEEPDEPATKILPKEKKQKKGKKNRGLKFMEGGLEEGITSPQSDDTDRSDGRVQKQKGGKAELAFAALMLDNDEQAESDGPSVSEEENKSLKHHHSRTPSSAFSALSMDDEDKEEQETPKVSPPPVKGSKTKTSNNSGLADDLQGQASAPHSEEDAAASGGAAIRPKDKKKKKKAKGGKGDIDDVFAALDEEDKAAGSTADISAEPGEAPQGKKKSTGRKTKGEEDIDALVAELDGKAGLPEETKAGRGPDAASTLERDNSTAESNVIQPIPDEQGPSTSKKKKKKGKGNKKDVEDIDAILAEIDGPIAGTEHVKEVTETSTIEVPETLAPASTDESQALGEEVQGDAQEGTKELSAAQKKKLKKKQKEKEKKLAKSSSTAVDEESVATKPKGKDGKVPLHVRRLQEEMERRRLAEEQLKKEEEERARREEEERKREEEAEMLRKEEAERKKKEKAEKQKQMKILAKQRAEEEKRARALKLLVKTNQSQEDADEARARDKLSYAEKKRQRALELEARKKAEDEARLLALEEERKRKEKERKEEEEEQKRQAEQKTKEVEGVDDWEQAADTWEDIDEDAPTGGQGEMQTAGNTPDNDASSSSAEGSESESEEESSSEEESTSYETDSEEAKERMIAEAKQKRAARVEEAKAQASADDLRSPICCILGHVDTGKTKILDNVRRTNVQDGEAGGITQQIGATYIPSDALLTRTADLRKGREYDMKVPGLLVIDTPGHESFTNLRSRGSSLCDIAILVVDLMHGLEPQTMESIGLLRQRKTPFIVALNKVDRLIDWKITNDAPIRDSLNRQKKHTTTDFEDRLKFCTTQLMEQGLNVALYWKNKDPRKYVSMVPTSAITGEGIPDLLQLLVKLTTSLMAERLMFLAELQCTVLEVKAIEGLGTTVDVVLVNGMLKEGDKIVVCGMAGPITTTIRSLLTPHPLKELRVKGSYLHHKQIRAAQGIKICAQGLERAVAGTALYGVGPDDDEEEAKALAQEEMEDVLGRIDKSGEGVSVQASTLGSLEALLDFLKSPEVSIPVSAIAIGPVHKKDVIRANVMNEKGLQKYGVILAFDVPVNREARDVAQELGVRIFTADIIYHLFDQFKAYMEEVKKAEKMAARDDAVFPCILKIIPTCIFNQKDPIVLGVEVVEGQARVGTPLCIPASSGRAEISLGRIDSMEVNHKMVEEAKAGDSFAVKIRATNSEESAKLYGRHFDHNDDLYSRISRESIDALKQFFKDEMEKDDWRLVVKLKSVFKIQ